MLQTAPVGNPGIHKTKDEAVGSTASGRKTVRIIGISVGQVECDMELLCIKLKLDGEFFGKLRSADRNTVSERCRWSLPLNLQEGSQLNIKLQSEWQGIRFQPRLQRPHRKKQLAQLTVSFENLRLFLDSAAQDCLIEYPIPVKPEMWLELQKETDAPREYMDRMAIQKSKELTSVLDHLGNRRGQLEIVLKALTAISELHPIAKAALGCVNVLYNLLQMQDQYIKQVQDLVENMDKTCGYICDVEKFARLPRLKKTMEEIRCLMEETENFVCSWTEKRGAVSFLKDNFDAEGKLEQLVQHYGAVLDQFDRGVTIENAANVNTILNRQENEEQEKLLKELWPKGIEFARTIAECMEGTREYLLSDIDSHLNDPEGPNILWVKGHPGVGKSALASTLASRLCNRHQLGSYFVFERAKAGTTTPNALWRHVAYCLAERYPSARQCIIEELKVKGVADTPNSEELFRRLVEQPLKKVMDTSLEHQPVIVIDGLDECGGLEGRRSEGRKALLKTLKQWPQLSSRAKLVIMSREEEDIVTALSAISRSIHILSGTSVTSETSDDIRTFFVRRFCQIAEHYSSLDHGWPGPSVIDTLTTRAAGLFIWARTTVEYVDDGEPTSRLQEITDHSLEMGDMADLYSLVLKTHFSRLKPVELNWFRVLVGAMVSAKRPLSRTESIGLLEIKEPMLDLICNGLRSVMVPGEALSFAHQSFVDFLLNDNDCPPNFFINPKDQHDLINGCLRTMSAKLCFNIGGLKTSTLQNADIPNVIEDNIPTYLSYACCHWTSHLSGAPPEERRMVEVKKLFYDQFLFWLEVMSLLGEMNQVPLSLQAVLAWSKLVPAGDENFQNFVKDAMRFVLAFRQPIAESAPHIYISALPFAPEQSLVARHFLAKYPNTISLATRKLTQWSPNLFFSEHQKHSVNRVVFSRDDRYFASVAGNICIYDTETGNLVSGPIEPHKGPSSGSIVFSPTGDYLASGSWDKTIDIWDSASGKEHQSFKITHNVQCLAYSNDGHKIASCSFQLFDDGEIRVWDVSSGREDQMFKSDNKPSVVVFSHDDQSIVLNSENGDVEIWDIHLGKCTMRTSLVMQEARPKHVTLSPDGRFAASADGSLIYTWNTRTGELSNAPWACRCFTHRLAYSTNSKYLVSMEHNPLYQVKVWDASTGQMVFGPLLPQTNSVIQEIAVSGDGKRVILGFDDGAVGMWSLDNLGVSPSLDPASRVLHSQRQTERVLDSQKQERDPFLTFLQRGGNSVTISHRGNKLAFGHQGQVGFWVWDASDGRSFFVKGNKSPAFSPDEKLVASITHSGLICIWDSKTGHLVCSSTLTEHHDGGAGLRFSPNSKNLVSISCNLKMACVWNTETMENPIKHILPHFEPERPFRVHLLFDNAGGIKLTWLKKGCIHTWSTKMEVIEIIVLKAPLDKPDIMAKFSQSRKLICSSVYSSEAKVWDVESGEAMMDIPKDFYYGQQAFSPDDCFIALKRRRDGTIEIFDLATCHRVRGPWYGDLGGCTQLIFSGDGKKLMSLSDETIKLWDTSDLTGTPPDHSSQTSHNPFTDDCVLEAGWVMTAKGEMLFWVPPSQRGRMWWPRNTAVIVRDGAPTKLDLAKFEYGDNWEKCRGY